MRAHGTKACYVFGPEPGGDRTKGCRCDECRWAICLYERERNRRIEPAYVRPISQSSWRAQAACRRRPVWLFFPAGDDRQAVSAAKKVCGACSVRATCLAQNLDASDGIFGGLTADERAALRKDQAA